MPEPRAPFELVEVPLPEPGPGEVLVEIVQTNVCGSDVHLWRGEIAPGFPRDVVLGHEMAGHVAALGPGAERDSAGRPLAVGDPITFRYYEPCGRCRSCARGLPRACAGSLASVLRPASLPPRLVGGFATHYLVTAGRSRFRLPDGVSPQVAAGANCALAQVVQGFREARLEPGETVVVQGCGGLGLYATAVAKARGARLVVAIDRIAARAELARRFGADVAIDASALDDPRERTRAVLEATGGEGGDVVVDVVGRAAVIAEGIRMLAPAGRYVEMGSIVPRDDAVVDASILVGGNRSIIGVALYDDRSLLEALDFLATTSAPVDELVGATFGLDELDRALQAASALDGGAPTVGRIGVRPGLGPSGALPPRP
jgi:D-arabinose 1-dehydrogenase-like Zn-dependent alcohol dehydrogenase